MNPRIIRKAAWRKVKCPICSQPPGRPCHLGSVSETTFFHHERQELAKRTKHLPDEAKPQQFNEFGKPRKELPVGEPLDLNESVTMALASVGKAPGQGTVTCRRCPTILRASNRNIGLCGNCQEKSMRVGGF